jgi:hypothetical protein
MTPQELLKHLKNDGDHTHTAIIIYLELLNTFSQGHARQNPSVNSKKKSDSEEEEKEGGEEDKEKEEEEEEEERASTALDCNEVSHDNVDMDACDLSNQGLDSAIAPEIQHDPGLEVTDGCDPFKSVLDKNELSQENFDMDANDQSKQGPEPDFGIENQNKPESFHKCTRCHRTDVILPGDLLTAKNMTGKLASRVNSQSLYHDVFTMYICHFFPNDLCLLKDIIQDIITTLTSPPKRCTKTPTAKFYLEVASWTTTRKATTAGSSLAFEDNFGEDRLSSQSTYKVNLDCLY